MARVTALTVNGNKMTVDVDSTVSLLSVLQSNKDVLGLTDNAKRSENLLYLSLVSDLLGVISMMIDVSTELEITTQVGRAAGKQITTIEGLERDGKLTPLQEAFIKADAMQCAYCTSGMIMTASALLNKSSRPNRDEIVSAMNGNICRCGTYQRIVNAIEIAAGTAREVA